MKPDRRNSAISAEQNCSSVESSGSSDLEQHRAGHSFSENAVIKADKRQQAKEAGGNSARLHCVRFRLQASAERIPRIAHGNVWEPSCNTDMQAGETDTNCSRACSAFLSLLLQIVKALGEPYQPRICFRLAIACFTRIASAFLSLTAQQMQNSMWVADYSPAEGSVQKKFYKSFMTDLYAVELASHRR